jgi:hypothetical protein
MMRFTGKVRRLRPLGLALIALSLSVGAPDAVAGVGSDQASGTSSVVDLPDKLLVAQWPTGQTTALSYLTQRQVAVLEPSSGALRPLVLGAQQPVVSPDGRDLYFVQYAVEGDTLRADVVMLSRDTLAQVWSTTVASVPRPPAQQPTLVARGIAPSADRVFVATSGGQKTDPLEIVALDRHAGQEQTRWRVDLGQAIA